MAQLIDKPAIVKAAGTPPKVIQEFIGLVNTGSEHVSIARMSSPPGWSEPGQSPGFTEYSLVLNGALHVRSRDGVCVVTKDCCVVAPAGEWVQYFTPDGAEYISVCVPAFSPDLAHRDEAAS